MSAVTIYTQPGCPYCRRALSLLASRNADVTEINAPHGTPARAESIARSGGRSSVPQIWIGDRHIGGCDDLVALDATGGLDPLLAA